MTPTEKFQLHMDQCWKCRTVRFCRLGRELLLAAAGYPTMIAIAEHLELHNQGDIESTLWLREHAPAVAELLIK